MKNPEQFQIEKFTNFLSEYSKEPKNTILRHALLNSGIETITRSQDFPTENDFKFSTDIKTMSITNQKSTGRCWIFAGLNVLREIIGKKLNINNFELSQSYFSLFDKLEKFNYEMEVIIDLIDKDYDDRTLNHILNNTSTDGGQWDMFVNIIKKYGIVPKNVFPETYTSSNTKFISKLINVEIRKFASISHEIYQNEKNLINIRKNKNILFNKICTLMINAFGIPPKNFDFEYIDKNEKRIIEKNLTPISFFQKYIGNEIDEFISIINAPTKSKPFLKSYTIEYLNNVVEGKMVKHLNLPMERIIELILNQLNDKEIVWFGADVNFYGDRKIGNFNDNMFDFQTPFGLDFSFDKGESLDFGISAMNHAMCVSGVNINESEPEKWKIVNSWGNDKGHNGLYLMSHSWFKKYVYQVVVRKKYLNEEELKAYEENPIVLKPWDPMGALAY